MINKRRFLAQRMKDAGLLSVIERLARRPGLLVLVYHRIGAPGETPDYGPVYSATPEGFRAQVLAIKRSFRVLGPDELVAAAAGDPKPSEPCAAITFDDGYNDQYDHALPVLAEAGVSATFFIPPAIIERPRPFWWDLVSRVVRQTDRSRLDLSYPSRLAVDLTRTTRDGAIASIVEACLNHRKLDEPRLIEQLIDRSGADLDLDALGRSTMMSWDRIRALAEQGMGIGSHGRTHRRLSDLDEFEQSEELVLSKRELEAKVGRDVTALSFPYGSPADYDHRTLRLAREGGYRAGFTFGGPPNRAGEGDPMRTSRISVGSADSPAMVRARLALGLAFGRSII